MIPICSTLLHDARKAFGLDKGRARALGFWTAALPKRNSLRRRRRCSKWLNKGFQGQMAWLEDHFDLRMDQKLVPGARSVISLMYNYFPEEQSLQESAPDRATLWAVITKVLRKKMNSSALGT